MKNNKKNVSQPKAKSDKILPLGDRVLIKLATAGDLETGNRFGIIIPETVNKEKPEQGKVVAVGEGKRDSSGKLIPLPVKVGDTVIFSKYSYDEVKHGEEEYVIVREENILAIVK